MMTNPMCAEKANNGLRNITGCPGIQSDVRRNPPNVALDQLECTKFGHFSDIFAIFQPLWYHTEVPEKPKFLVKVPFDFKRSTGNFTEVEKEYPTSRSGSVERSHAFGSVNRMIFGTM